MVTRDVFFRSNAVGDCSLLLTPYSSEVTEVWSHSLISPYAFMVCKGMGY